MNAISLIFHIIGILILIIDVRPDCLDESDVVEKLYWAPENKSQNIEWEFSIIGKRVAWDVGRTLCSSSQTSPKGPINEDSIEDTLLRGTPSMIRWNSRNLGIRGLAVFNKAAMKSWLARMLSESNYHYDGLWIGGHRNGAGNNWTWIGTENHDEFPVPTPSIVSAYPEWYKTDKVLDDSLKNCLVFERTGHNLPILVPTDCRMKKPFVCSRIVSRKPPPRIVEGQSVFVDRLRYTIFSVDDHDEISLQKNAGFRRLNGGGVKWTEARLECRKRGQYLATVLSNEAAKKIAAIMLKNRPSIESAWLGGWSGDGAEWKWSTTGLVLPSDGSSSGHYPPWLTGHPIKISKLDQPGERRSKCLILDRHLCPDHTSPVFLDLDCNKKRPFVCQDGISARRYGQEIAVETTSNEFSVDARNYRFSSDRMTWNEGQVYCSKKNGKVASILDSKTLSTILDRMADLYLDHVWVGGKTLETSEGWKWVDATGKPLKSEEIGMRSFWCLGNDESVLSKPEPNSCLNLDREGHGLPLFYGLPCNSTMQHVLCSFDEVLRSADSSYRKSGKKLDLTTSNDSSINRHNVNDNKKTDGHISRAAFEFPSKNKTQVGGRIAEFDEKPSESMTTHVHNISDTDFVLNVDLKVLNDLQNNSTLEKLNGTRNFQITQ